MGHSGRISLTPYRTADDTLSYVLAVTQMQPEDDAREAGVRYPRRAIYGLQLRNDSQGSHAPSRSSRRVCTMVNPCVAESQNKGSLCKILECVDPSAELVVSEP
jgi:hypothetical protein